mmetsp:Transcript_6630/g.19591  ORF Transcript_6630/g.19591 Transcript_6630/m.19591 type:complete len:117 (-) Transcript_6630:806-1156(-)
MRSYSRGKLAPDIAPPHIADGLDDSCQLVRLRPSTAALLVRLAGIGTGDVVLDPFAGVGTMPLEASLLSSSTPSLSSSSLSSCFRLGGDVAIGSSADFAAVASEYAVAVQRYARRQ